MTFECPRTGEDCVECPAIAEAAYIDGYRRKYGDVSNDEIVFVTADADVPGKLEALPGFLEQGCAGRQALAQTIGKRAALGADYKIDDGGDDE
ncbi:MAG: hypothetical protein V4678_04760 [Patescibacteria group bacterium]